MSPRKWLSQILSCVRKQKGWPFQRPCGSLPWRWGDRNATTCKRETLIATKCLELIQKRSAWKQSRKIAQNVHVYKRHLLTHTDSFSICFQKEEEGSSFPHHYRLTSTAAVSCWPMSWIKNPTRPASAALWVKTYFETVYNEMKILAFSCSWFGKVLQQKEKLLGELLDIVIYCRQRKLQNPQQGLKRTSDHLGAKRRGGGGGGNQV